MHACTCILCRHHFLSWPSLITGIVSKSNQLEGSRWDQLLDLIVFLRPVTLVADSWFSHDSGYFSQDGPTNVQLKKLSLLCGGVNEIHHPQTIRSFEFKASLPPIFMQSGATILSRNCHSALKKKKKKRNKLPVIKTWCIISEGSSHIWSTSRVFDQLHVGPQNINLHQQEHHF